MTVPGSILNYTNCIVDMPPVVGEGEIVFKSFADNSVDTSFGIAAVSLIFRLKELQNSFTLARHMIVASEIALKFGILLVTFDLI